MEAINIEYKIKLKISIYKSNFDMMVLGAEIMNEVPELRLS